MTDKFRFLDDGYDNWYMVPEELCTKFKKIIKDGGDDNWDEFDLKFQVYRCKCPSDYLVTLCN